MNFKDFLKKISKEYNISFSTELDSEERLLKIEYERYRISYYGLESFEEFIQKDEKEYTIEDIELFLNEKVGLAESYDNKSWEENGILVEREECTFELEDLKEIDGELVLSKKDQEKIISLFEELEEDRKSALEQEQKNLLDIEKMKNKLEELKRTE